jgi:MFS transporter, FSR family, fosmidomycin resistance protein
MQLKTGLGLVATAHFANDAVTSMFPALLPSLATRFRLEAAELALLVSVFAVSTSLPQPLFGLFADRLGRNRVGAGGLVVSAALMASLSLVTSVHWLWPALLLGGLGSSALHPAGIGLARVTASANPGLAVAVFSSAGMAGGAIGPLVAIGVASAWGFEQLAWVAVPVLLVAVILARFRPGASVAAPQRSTIRLGLGLVKGPVAWLVLVALLANLVALTFTSAVPVWLVTERGLSETSSVIALTLAVFSMAAAVGGILGGVLARRLPTNRIVVGSLALSALALESVLLAAPGSSLYVVAVAAAGALLGMHSPLLIARAQELSPGAESAMAGILLGATSGAAGLIYAGFGAVQSLLGVGGTLTAVSLLVLPAAHLAAVAFRSCSQTKVAPLCPSACEHSGGCCAALAAAV